MTANAGPGSAPGTRAMMASAPPARTDRQRWRLPAAVVLLIVIVAGGAYIGLRALRLAVDKGHVVVETVLGETPERRVAQYFDALARGDREAALAIWSMSENASEPLRERREAITDELLGVGSTISYSIEGTEWWRNCCEPGLIADPSAAGVARFHVTVSGAGGERERRYTIDVTTPGAYWGAAGGNPVRRWLLRDVYRPSEQPLAFPWPAETETPSGPQALGDVPRDMSLWPTYTSTEWPLTLSYPPGWTLLEVAYAQQDYGPVIRVSNGGRVLELVRRSNLPPDRSSSVGSASIGRMGALVYYQEGGMGGQSTRRMLLVPVGAGDMLAYASIELAGTGDDAEYLQIFLMVLSSIVFG